MTKIGGSQNLFEIRRRSAEETRTNNPSQMDSASTNAVQMVNYGQRASATSSPKDIDGVLDSLGTKSTQNSSSSAATKAADYQKRIESAKTNEEKRAIAKEMLKDGDSQISEANNQRQECQSQINQTKSDMAVAQKNGQDAVNQTQTIKTRMTALTQRKEAMLRDVQTTSAEIMREQQKMQQKNRLI